MKRNFDGRLRRLELRLGTRFRPLPLIVEVIIRTYEQAKEFRRLKEEIDAGDVMFDASKLPEPSPDTPHVVRIFDWEQYLSAVVRSH